MRGFEPKAMVALVVLLPILSAGALRGDDPPRGAGPRVRRFDADGDGTLDETERRAARAMLRARQAEPAATRPAGRAETVGGRTVTDMEYASSDGRRIPCVLSMPAGDGPFPVVVTIHGGQGNRDIGFIRSLAAPGGVSPTVTALNEQPWAILAISYRAGGGAVFGMEQDDVVAGIRHAKTLPGVDPDRVGVLGGSHGGHLALVAAETMGREFLCVAAGSPWMTDPLVPMTGDPGEPPLSEVPPGPREALVATGRRLFESLKRGRGMSEEQAREFLARQSIEAHADRIEIPTLLLTSRGDDQVPHALVAPLIGKMQAAGREVEVYTAEKSPHGFYWARSIGAARALRGAKTPEETREEDEARRRIIDFFSRHFHPSAREVPGPPAALPGPAETHETHDTHDADESADADAVAAGPVDRSLPWVTGDAGVPGVVFRTFQSAAAAGPVSYHVFTPPEHDDPATRLPVLYWLHGTLGGLEGIRPVTAHFAARMRARRMPPMLVVFVNGLPRRLWADSKGGSAPVETVFVTELIAEVDRSFRTLAAREGRILEGFSMGGYGAARIGFGHPDLFAGISILAGGPLDLDLDGPRARRNPRLREFILREVCGGEIDYFRAISPWTIAGKAAPALERHGTLIRQAIGTRDDTRDLNHAFHERMTEVGIAHAYHEIPDVGHDARGVLEALAAIDGDFYRRALGSPAGVVGGDGAGQGAADP